MALAVGGLILVQRLVPIALRRQHNDVAGFIYAVLGVTYAVLLGLMVVAVWEQWEAAKVTADDEASSLAEIFWIADRLPESDGRHIQELARSYARVVVDEEWALMEQEKSSPRAWDLLDDIRASLQDFDPSTPEEQVLYEQSLERMRDLADARRDRLLEAEQGLPAILWVVLDNRGNRRGGLHLPLRPGKHHDPPPHGGLPGPDNRPRPLHGRRPQLPVQGRHNDPSRSHGTRPRQVPVQQAQRFVTRGAKPRPFVRLGLRLSALRTMMRHRSGESSLDATACQLARTVAD